MANKIKLRKLTQTDSRNQTEYWGQFVNYGASKPTTDGISEDTARYDHKHTFPTLLEKPTTITGYGITDAVPMGIYGSRNGVLVKTSIKETQNFMCVGHITGNSYNQNSNIIPFNTIIQFYSYEITDKILDARGVNYGQSFGDISVFIYEGFICLWFNPTGLYDTFFVNISGTPTHIAKPNFTNMVVSLTNIAKPTEGVTREVIIKPQSIVYEGDARLTDTRNAKDVYAWAKAQEKPVYKFEEITIKPTTLAGYGITDGALKNHTHTFAEITTKPTTLAGYGITDGALKNHTHTASTLTFDNNFQCVSLVDKNKLLGLKSQTAMEVWVSNEILSNVEKIEWRNAVDNYSELIKILTPLDGWMVPVLQDQTIADKYYQSGDYRYHDNATHPTGQTTGWYLINSTKVPNASETINGLMTSADYSLLKSLSAGGAFPGFGTGAGQVAEGNHNHDNIYTKLSDPRLTDSRNAKDVSEWAKAPLKPVYAFSEITTKPSTLGGYGITDASSLNHTHTNIKTGYLTQGGMFPPNYIEHRSVKFNLSNQFSKRSYYYDCMLMNSYGDSTGGSPTVFGISKNKAEPRAIFAIGEWDSDKPEDWTTYELAKTIDITWSNILDKPTTIAGFGITDVFPKGIFGAIDGILIKTDISKTTYTFCNVNITGNSNGNNDVLSMPYNTNIQFYHYPNGTSLKYYSAIDYGESLGNISVFIMDDVICMWIEGVQMQLFVNVIGTQNDNQTGTYTNRVVSIQNSPKPTVGITEETTIIPKSVILNDDTRLTDARKASDVQLWAKAPVKPIYKFEEITEKPTTVAGYGITDAVPMGIFGVTNGILVRTSIKYNLNSMCVGHITGNSFEGKIPFNTYIEFYSYADRDIMMSAVGINYGKSLGDISVFIYEGFVCLWFNSVSINDTIFVNISGTSVVITKPNFTNMVVSLTHIAKPTEGVTREAIIKPQSIVYEGDARLTDSRKASDVSAWAKTPVKPAYAFSEITNKPTTLAGYGITDGGGSGGASTWDELSGKPTTIDGYGITDKIIVDGDARLTDSRKASDVYLWAKSSSKPAYAFSEITNKPTTIDGYGITDKIIVDGDARLTDSRKASDVSAWAKTTVKPAYAFSEITNKPTTLAGYGITDGGGSGGASTWDELSGKPTTIDGYGITDAVSTSDSRLSDSRSASDVYSWAKSSSKPSYSASEVGALSTSATCNRNWSTTKQSSTPSYLWGTDESGANNNYLYNPRNFSVNYATSAGTASSADYATSAGTATRATNADYATSAGTATRATYANGADADFNMNSKMITNCADISFSSDIRLKTNLIQIDNDFMTGILDIKPYQYEMKNNMGKKRIGYIAQQVKPIFPDVVSNIKDENDEESLSLSYREISILKTEALINEVKTLKEELQHLKEIFCQMQSEIILLKSDL